MQSLVNRYGKWGATGLFGLLVFLFWGVCYPAHLCYQEQFQLFLFDADYWRAACGVPGGIADYVAEYLTQFFLFPWMGALVMALLLMALQGILWALARREGARSRDYLWSFLPVLLLWAHLLDESVMLSYVVALCMALLTAWRYRVIRGRGHQFCFVLIAIPFLYWIAGSAHFLFAVWLAAYELVRNIRRTATWTGICIVGGVAVWAVVTPLIAVLVVHYPAYRLLCGIDYYRYPEVVPWAQLAFWPLMALWPLLMSLLACWKGNLRWAAVVQVVAWAAAGWLLAQRCDWEKEELMAYDRLVRNRQWEAVVAKADKKAPQSPFGVTCLNLALGKCGVLGDRMFRYYQNGTEGLLPTFERDFVSPLPLGEVFYHLGMVNSAQRVAFETMEAIPNYKKSARAIKRLAETNLINGQYAVAAKYLRMLCKTLFYDRWAERALACLADEEKIATHPEWGRLRQLRYTDDFLFSEGELVDMLGLLYEHNHSNRLAFEYLLAYVMENRDVERFMRYYPLGRDAGYKHIPRHYQEALVFVWTQQHSSFQGMPWSISPEVMREVGEFARIHLSRKPEAKNLLQARFGDTYWYYLLYPSR